MGSATREIEQPMQAVLHGKVQSSGYPYTHPTLRVQAGVQAMLQLEVQPWVWQLWKVVFLSFGRQSPSAGLPFKDGSVSSIRPAGWAGTSLSETLNSGSLQALTMSAVDISQLLLTA